MHIHLTLYVELTFITMLCSFESSFADVSFSLVILRRLIADPNKCRSKTLIVLRIVSWNFIWQTRVRNTIYRAEASMCFLCVVCNSKLLKRERFYKLTCYFKILRGLSKDAAGVIPFYFKRNSLNSEISIDHYKQYRKIKKNTL